MRTALVIALILGAGIDAGGTQAARASDPSEHPARAVPARIVGPRRAPTLVHADGGRVDYAPAGACLTEAQVQESPLEVESNLAHLRQTRVIPHEPTTSAHPLLEFPLRAAEHLQDPGFYYLFAYFDHAPSFGQLLDYECGRRTHNAGDGAHSGVDWNLWSFNWNRMDDEDVEVVAAAPGVVALRREGHEDRSCPGAQTSDWNGIVLRHNDGSLAYYSISSAAA